MLCEICNIEITIEGVALPGCAHRFCYTCIDRRLLNRNTCPICIAEIVFLQKVNLITGEMGRREVIEDPCHNAQTTPPPLSPLKTERTTKRKRSEEEPVVDMSLQFSPKNSASLFSPQTPEETNVADPPERPEDFTPLMTSTLRSNDRNNFELICMYLGLSQD